MVTFVFIGREINAVRVSIGVSYKGNIINCRSKTYHTFFTLSLKVVKHHGLAAAAGG